MPEPVYSFSLPSINDDTPLDCRIYHPKTLQSTISGGDGKARITVKGAVIAHPYAPLGGCYDDPVVLSLCETLLEEGFVVGTFNFRGAAGSAGSTSWTGKGEQGDYMSCIGFLIHYLQNLYPVPAQESTHLEPIVSMEYESAMARDASTAAEAQRNEHIDLLLGGYSYGSLVLARLPAISTIIQRFRTAEKGTAATEIILRANTLSAETRRGIEAAQSPTSPRGRQLRPEDGATSPIRRTAASPITLGGEETDPSERRRSRDSRRSGDLVRKSMEKVHIKRQSTARSSQRSENDTRSSISPTNQPASAVSVRYLLISPVLLPFTQSLCPPGPPSVGLSLGKQAASSSGALFLENPTLAIFGSKDSFTSSQRLEGWAEKQAKSSNSTFEWEDIQGAGHFWREEGVMQALQHRVVGWVNSSFAGLS